MAWTPRRARRARRAPAANSPQPEHGSWSAASGGDDRAPAEPGRTEIKHATVFASVPAATGRDWRRVPALKLTIAPVPRLVGGVAYALPDVGGTRLLLRPPLGASRDQSIAGLDDDGPLAGRVSGLISSSPLARPAVRAGRSAAPEPQDDVGPPEGEPQSRNSHGLRRALSRAGRTASGRQGSGETPAEVVPAHTDTPPPPMLPRRARPVSRTPAERVPLVEAAGEFVGEPQASETPYASSAWLRMVQSYLPEAPGSQIPGMSSPGLTETVKPDGGTVRSWSSAAVAEPPRLQGSAERGSAQGGPSASAAPQVPARRATLAESRRLGLGAPLTHPRSRPSAAGEDGDEGAQGGDAEPEQEQSVPRLHRTTARDTAAVTPSPAAEVSALLLAEKQAAQDPEPRPTPNQLTNSEPPATARPVSTLSRQTLPATPAAPKPASPRVSPQPGSPVYRAAVRAPALNATQPTLQPHHHGPALTVTGELVHRLPPPTPREPETKGAPRTDAARPAQPSETGDGWVGQAAPPGPATAPIQFAPPELAETLRRLHGVDVSNVPIRRDAEAAERAHSLGARAFTDGGQVFIPQSEGSLDQPRTRALLAHELTHAAQHRLLGAGLPDESSAAGRALEAAAVATEQWTLGQTLHPAMHPVSHPEFAGHMPQAGPTAPQRAVRAPSPPSAVLPPAVLGAPTASATPLTDLPLPRNPPDPAYGLVPPAAPHVEATRTHPPIIAAQPDPAGRDLTALPGATGQAGDGESVVLAGQLARLARQRPLDLDDTAAVDELADDLYRRFHSRLRRELLVDRERSGALGNFG